MMKRIILILCIGLLVGSCKKGKIDSNPDTDGVDVIFGLTISGSVVTRTGGEAAKDDKIDDITLLVFDNTSGEGTGAYLYNRTGTLTTGATEFTASLRLSATPVVVHIFANSSAKLASDQLQEPFSGTEDEVMSGLLTSDDNPSTTTNLPMHSKITFQAITEETTTTQDVKLLRAVARIDINASGVATETFSLTGACVYFTPKQGRLVSTSVTGYNTNTMKASTATMPTTAVERGVTGAVTVPVDNKIENKFFVYENDDVWNDVYTPETLPDMTDWTDNNQKNTRIVVSGKYGGETCYYPLDFRNAVNSAYMDVLRNYNYTFTVTAVTGPGYDDPLEAANNKSKDIVVKVKANNNWNTVDQSGNAGESDGNVDTGTGEWGDGSMIDPETGLPVGGTPIKPGDWGGDNDMNDGSVGGLHYSMSNSAMVTPGGSAGFDIRKMTKGGEGITVPEGLGVSDVVLLWEDTQGLINQDEITLAGTNLTIPTTDNVKTGNAVVAIKNNAGEIMWSWHIWVTDYQPDYHTAIESGGTNKTYDVAGGQVHQYSGSLWGHNKIYADKVIMDRHLGATVTGIAKGGAVTSAVGIKAWGLFYQWGRKDPFVGRAEGTSGTTTFTPTWGGNPYAVNTGIWALGEMQGAGATEALSNAAAIKNPTSFSKSANNLGPWTTPSTGTYKGDKSDFDPCPEGWRVPDGNTWSNFTRTSAASYTFGPDYYTAGVSGGRTYKGVASGEDIAAWYPASGYRNLSSGALDAVGADGLSWSSSVSGTNGGYMVFGTTSVNPATFYRACGMSVRCLQE